MLHNGHWMFTWICPKCGAAVDIAQDTCPQCSGGIEPSAPEEDATNVVEAPPEPTVHHAEAQLAQAAAPPPETTVESEMPAPEPEPVEAAARPSGLHMARRHYAMFAGGLVLAILVAVWLGRGFSGLRLEDPGEAEASPVEAFAIGAEGPIEVSGIRPYYDEDFQTHVRAFVANHSEEERSVALRALLRVREAGRGTPPIATFSVVTPNPLPPNGGREIDVPLRAMGSLQSLPRWDEMRVDLDPM